MKNPRNRVRLLILLESTLGGTRKYVVDLLRGLDQNRFHITFGYATDRADDAFWNALRELQTENTIDLVKIPMRREISPLVDLKCFLMLLGIIWRGNFHLVHCHSSKAGFLGRLATKLASPTTPTIYSPNAMAINIHWIYKYLEKFASLFTDRIIAAAPSERNEIIQNRIIPSRKVTTITLGTEVHSKTRSPRLREELQLARTTILVISVARCTRQKDPFTFFEAGKRLISEGHDVHFAWLGNGDLEDEIKQLISSEKFKGRATFLGHRPDTQELFSGADIFVLASLYESFGYVTCEAMAWEIPVVATNVPGTQTVVADNVTGFLVEPQNAQAMADRILRFANDPALRSRMGRNGKQRLKEMFSLEKMLRETEALYDEVLVNGSRWKNGLPVHHNSSERAVTH